MIKLDFHDHLVVLWIIMHRLSVAGWSHQRILLFNALLTCYTGHIVCRHFYTALCRVFQLSFIYCKYVIVNMWLISIYYPEEVALYANGTVQFSGKWVLVDTFFQKGWILVDIFKRWILVDIFKRWILVDFLGEF